MEVDEEAVIDIKEFLETRLALIREDYFSRNKNVRDAIKADLNLPEAAFAKLEEMCNPSKLNSHETQDKIETIDALDSTYMSTIEFMKNMSQKSSKRTYPLEIKFMKNLARLNEIEPSEDDMIQTPDVILTVQLSNPLSKAKKIACSEEFQVLGQNFLWELKDKIACFRDEIKVGEFSEDPDQIKNAPQLKDLIKSGYFLIENTVYNDLRNGNTDCSEPILKWSAEQNLTFESKDMESIKFIDLKIRLGYPYLYNHLGNCQHLIVFSSLKLVNPSSDCYSKSKYPIIKERIRGRFTFCWCCNTLYAKWIVSNSIFSVDDPTFLCERCLKNTHYLNKDSTTPSNENNEDEDEEENKPSEQLQKACDFTAYHYSQI